MPVPRELVTIGGLRAQPLGRARDRRRAILGLQSMGSATADTAGSALQSAAADLLNYLDANGVPSEHEANAQVGIYQRAWNADPANATDQLVVDEGYGPLTQGTLNVLTGGIAPAVNTGPPGTTPPRPAPVTPVTPSPVAPSSGESEVGFWILLAAVGVGAYFLLRKKKGKTVHHHHPASAAIELRSNPRRRRRNGAELIP